ncbi:MAG: hypothetical protein GXN97_01550 [Aquificae bacterium]|nr:hypothetical protein [Aquificota bacterium]
MEVKVELTHSLELDLKLTKKSIESVKISGNLNIEPLGGIASEFVVKKLLKEKILEELRKAGFKGKLIVDGEEWVI